MKILIDNADIQEIKKAYEYFPITGVTCNPTILKRTGRNPYDVLTVSYTHLTLPTKA